MIHDLIKWINDTGFNLEQEAISTILQTLVVAPTVSLIISWRQRLAQKKQLTLMIPHILGGIDPIRSEILNICEGSDGDFFRGGLSVFAKQFEHKTSEIYSPNNLLFYLGHPSFLSKKLDERISAHVDHVDGLLGLFSPHFRTEDSVNAQRLRHALRVIEKNVKEIRDSVDYLAGTAESTCKFLASITDFNVTHQTSSMDDAKERTSSPNASEDGTEQDQPFDADTKKTLHDQATESTKNQAESIIQRFDDLPSALDMVADAGIALFVGFYDGKLDFEEIIKELEKKSLIASTKQGSE